MKTRDIENLLIHSWNVFDKPKYEEPIQNDQIITYGRKPDRPRLSYSNEKSIIAAIYTRIANDVASMDVRHVRTEDGAYVSDISSNLQNCFDYDANIDQTGKDLLLDAALSLLDEGSIAIVPTETTINPDNGGFDIIAVRVCKILEWMPKHVKVHIYNDIKGTFEDIVVPKKTTTIVQNPFYSVMNEPNSTSKRLGRKLGLLDIADEKASSGKLDLIFQLPYTIRSQQRRDEAAKRRQQIEDQLTGSRYGVAYVDATERITQLNRPAENNLMAQIEYLTRMLYSQLGMSESVFDGTADEQTMLNYHNSTVVPVITAIVDGMNKAFLTKTGRTQGQRIMYFREPFKNVPTSKYSDMADSFSRNELMSSNELRSPLGLKPSKDPKADELRNKNIAAPAEETINPQPNKLIEKGGKE